MTNLSVQEKNGILVVDSRLIAQQLEIEHRALLQTLEKYLNKIETSFGTVAFQMREFKTKRGNRSTERIAWLTEEQATLLMTFSRNTERVVECKIALVKAFTEAKQLIKEVIPAQAQELERLRLELELAKTQERLLTTTSAITTMHGAEMVALILGKPDAIITKIERVETVVTVDRRGKAISNFDGVGITFLAKKYGFGSNTKACRYWLETIGVTDEQWVTEPTLVKAQKLPREIIPWLDRAWANKKGVRQRQLGE